MAKSLKLNWKMHVILYVDYDYQANVYDVHRDTWTGLTTLKATRLVCDN